MRNVNYKSLKKWFWNLNRFTIEDKAGVAKLLGGL